MLILVLCMLLAFLFWGHFHCCIPVTGWNNLTGVGLLLSSLVPHFVSTPTDGVIFNIFFVHCTLLTSMYTSLGLLISCCRSHDASRDR